MPSLPAELAPLDQALRQAADVAASARARLCVERKPDGSLVTNADRDVEAFLRERLAGLRPGATVWGEEMGYEAPGAGGLWLVDPVDGTSNFAYGQPLWGVTVGLMEGGVLTLGGVALPDLDEWYVAGRGLGAYRNGERMAPVSEGKIGASDLVGHAESIVPEFEALGGKTRMLGAFVIEAMFVATGRLRAMTSHRCHLYDAAGSIVVCREVGLEVRMADGTDFCEADHATPVRLAWFGILPAGAF